MEIDTALILCAGFGKRLNPITFKIPKPLIKINNITLLENTLNLIYKLKIKKIKINVYYLEDQITDFLSTHRLKNNIEIIKDGDEILDTGGGLNNLIKSTDRKDFLVFNSDTLWNDNYIKTINNMIYIYEKEKMKNLLLVVNKSRSYDKRFLGDFELKNNLLEKRKVNNFIFTGFQIINRDLFKNISKKIFSVNEIWNQQIKENKLFGFESLENFVHLTDIEIYNRLIKNN
tara:strand:- start:1379 stop:2071 length:693 start_codon:yes stop_codon:yes gene_type:complete